MWPKYCHSSTLVGVRHRDRRGRGLRGRLVPPTVPMSRTRSQTFDDLVLETVEALERIIEESNRFGKSRLRDVEFAVEDVPPESHQFDTDVLEDRDVALARLIQSSAGSGPPSRVVLYRRPLELRAHGTEELAALVRGVLVEQIANLLGTPPEDIDPDL